MIDFDRLVLGPCIGIFGEQPAAQPVYQPANRAPAFLINGVFDLAYRPIDPLVIEGMEPSHVTTAGPCLGVALSSFPNPPLQGDLVTIRGTLYRVSEVRSDGVGGARLMLNTA